MFVRFNQHFPVKIYDMHLREAETKLFSLLPVHYSGGGLIRRK